MFYDYTLKYGLGELVLDYLRFHYGRSLFEAWNIFKQATFYILRVCNIKFFAFLVLILAVPLFVILFIAWVFMPIIILGLIGASVSLVAKSGIKLF